MKNINIAAFLILGFTLLADERQSSEEPKVCVPTIKTQVETEKEVVVELSEPIANSFSRPRKPCPPSGPGRR